MRKIKINKDGNVEIQHFDTGGTVLAGPSGGGTTDSSTNPNSGFLGSINQALGLNNNFQAQAANIQQGTNVAQLNNAYNGVQSSLDNQNQFANALAAQHGLGNQSNVFNQQQALAGALTDQAAGRGPNPAQTQLAQNTAANTANQAALMAGQRGSAANVGLIARQAAMQGAQNQQAAAGQAATLQAQQQLAAQGALANQQAQMQGVASNQIAAQGQQVNSNAQAQQGEQSILQNANTSANNAAVGMQENMNNNNSATSAANANMASNTMGGLLKGASSIASMFAKGGVVGAKKMPAHIKGMAMLFHPAHKFADGGEIQDEPAFEAPPKESAESAQENIDDKSTSAENESLDSDKGSAPSSSSEDVDSKWSNANTAASNGPGGGAAVSLPADQTNFADSIQSPGGSGGGGGGGLMSLAAMMAKGGQIPRYANGGVNLAGSFGATSSMSSSGPGGGAAVGLPVNNSNLADAFASSTKKDPSKPKSDKEMAGGAGDDSSDQNNPDGSDTGATKLAAEGGKIGGKPKVPGAKDSYRNDTQPAMLSPGEIVLPRHVTQSSDPVGNAAKFVAALLAKHQDNPSHGNEEQDFKMALKKAISSRKR